jgi:hypothetical protein
MTALLRAQVDHFSLVWQNRRMRLLEGRRALAHAAVRAKTPMSPVTN